MDAARTNENAMAFGIRSFFMMFMVCGFSRPCRARVGTHGRPQKKCRVEAWRRDRRRLERDLAKVRKSWKKPERLEDKLKNQEEKLVGWEERLESDV
jgi:hypothetical protein